MNLTTNILSNGIKQLLSEDDNAFKKGMSQCLSLKLNSAIEEINQAVAEKLFENFESTPQSNELKYFVNFVKNYDPKTNFKLKLKNQSVINISESDMDSLKNLFESLSSQNRDKMVKDILESPYRLKQNISFYQKAKKLL
jgi:hypothetical protein